MNYELAISELTKLHNNKFFENKRLNGLIIKLYKKFRKELRKFNSSCTDVTNFHKEVAVYAAGIIGYYSQEKSLNNYFSQSYKR